MLQKINTALLVAILGVLVFVALRPQQGRYYYAKGYGYSMAVLDTATGELDFRTIEYLKHVDEREKWRADQEKAKAEAARAKREIAQMFWLEKNCPDVLAGKVSASQKPRTPRNKTVFSPEEFIGSIPTGPSREECEKWQKEFPPVGE